MSFSLKNPPYIGLFYSWDTTLTRIRNHRVRDADGQLAKTLEFNKGWVFEE